MFENDVSSRDAAVFKAHYPDIFSETFLQPNLKGKFLNKITFVLENLYSLSIVLLILAREPFFFMRRKCFYERERTLIDLAERLFRNEVPLDKRLGVNLNIF